MKLYDKGAYLLNGTELVEDGRDAADIIKSRTGETITSSEAAKNTIAYGILKEHNTSGPGIRTGKIPDSLRPYQLPQQSVCGRWNDQ